MSRHPLPCAHATLRRYCDGRPLPTDTDPLILTLEDRLAVALGGDERFGPLEVCWPTEAASVVDELHSFNTNSVWGFGPLDLDADLDVRAITERFALVPASVRVDELQVGRLTPCADDHGREPLTKPIPMKKWITFETTVDDTTYCLHQDRWFAITDQRVLATTARTTSPSPSGSATTHRQPMRHVDLHAHRHPTAST